MHWTTVGINKSVITDLYDSEHVGVRIIAVSALHKTH